MTRDTGINAVVGHIGLDRHAFGVCEDDQLVVCSLPDIEAAEIRAPPKMLMVDMSAMEWQHGEHGRGEIYYSYYWGKDRGIHCSAEAERTKSKGSHIMIINY